MGVVDLNAMNVSNGATFITHIPELKRAKKHATNGIKPMHIFTLIFSNLIIPNRCAKPSRNDADAN